MNCGIQIMSESKDAWNSFKIFNIYLTRLFNLWMVLINLKVYWLRVAFQNQIKNLELFLCACSCVNLALLQSIAMGAHTFFSRILQIDTWPEPWLDMKGPLSKFSLVGSFPSNRIKSRISSIKLFNFWGPLRAMGP
jgi:hypothetical protein